MRVLNGSQFASRVRWHWRQRRQNFVLNAVTFCLIIVSLVSLFAGSTWHAERKVGMATQIAGQELRVVKPTAPLVAAPGVGEQLPALSSYAGQLQNLYDSAEGEGLTISAAEYHWRAANDPELMQLSIVLPLRGEYAKLQRFFAVVLFRLPSLGIESLQLQRAKADMPELEIRLQLVLYLRRGEAT